MSISTFQPISSHQTEVDIIKTCILEVKFHPVDNPERLLKYFPSLMSRGFHQIVVDIFLTPVAHATGPVVVLSLFVVGLDTGVLGTADSPSVG